MSGATKSTLLFVHGTGVRSESYTATLKQVESKVAEFHLPCSVESCEWGDVYGIDFDGSSLPDPPQRSEDEEAQAYRWEYLQVDPLFDLRLWCTPAAEPPKKVLGAKSAASVAWERSISNYISEYDKKVALVELLRHNQIEGFFLPAWNKVVATGLANKAFAAAGDDGPAMSRVFAEAVVAQMMHDAAAAQPPVAISPRTGGKIVTVLLFDWNQAAKGLKDLFLRFFGSAPKRSCGRCGQEPVRQSLRQSATFLITRLLDTTFANSFATRSTQFLAIFLFWVTVWEGLPVSS